ncbi:excinuclease ABC subunit C [[Clostridium] sordellii]|uniref:UvrABC system protein C n=1 Tax=Paraclostridium sordellii TaxID=1505 RepID=A0ABM9RK12_PARSO|nr:excinuclease ABC subunit UvrC [Paeniclostridium sordellii]CEJ72293.1 Excinuclease ABC subunit C [[Clostridium] sordellii] [Paeniclostridium sordellii]CEN70519.1 excinuclease ABC subunit C [[Clostridium] sordellii] [Paeniclostridium sordellii]CEN73984.1 excinuclease ABC subunit C [[Clostridium] sordellii] [Paeniclostridium sordellii]CEO28243.1 excinuclease ABC subunit C [[Clostridium] sordellii] [Paeniclostridium sordellii]CEP77273.1 excinuclease ABC subunit C [[Clostridium] sordellii] [Paen
MFDIQEQLKKLPSEPGVYLMKDENDKVIYVGKAISLKNRVRQYFQSSKNHTSKVKSMVKNIYKFEYIITDSELEALILECSLIKEYRPKYNVLLRDDKTYPYIKVTVNEDFPRVLKVRQVIKDKAKYFGPYTNTTAVNDTLEIIRNIYPIRTCNIDIERAIKNKVRPCLNKHIKKCVGPCTGEVSKEEYSKMIEEIILFLSGKEEHLIDLLKEKMNKCAMEFNFEDAAMYRDKIKSLEEMTQKQKIDSITSDLNQDIIAMARAHDEACVQVFFIRNGKIVGREHYILEGIMDSTRESILSSFVKQFYMAQDYIPKEILIESDIEDSFILEEWLSDKKGQKVFIRVPQKGEKKSLIEMVRKNAVEYLEKFSNMNKLKYRKSIGALEELKNIIGLEKIPRRIESFDISNIQGVDSIGSMVVFTDGKKDKKEYRRYKIKTVIGPNDYDSMAEIVERRIKYGDLPDLILLDGGKGQVSSVKKVLNKHNVEIPLWGMYKDDKHRTKGLISQEKEIELDKTSNLYRFVASIQEEVHNYAISYHRSLRNKTLTKSILDDIQGIGEKRKKALLSHFKNIDEIKNATMNELLEVEGMNKTSAENVYNFLKS